MTLIRWFLNLAFLNKTNIKSIINFPNLRYLGFKKCIQEKKKIKTHSELFFKISNALNIGFI